MPPKPRRESNDGRRWLRVGTAATGRAQEKTKETYGGHWRIPRSAEKLAVGSGPSSQIISRPVFRTESVWSSSKNNRRRTIITSHVNGRTNTQFLRAKISTLDQTMASWCLEGRSPISFLVFILVACSMTNRNEDSKRGSGCGYRQNVNDPNDRSASTEAHEASQSECLTCRRHRARDPGPLNQGKRAGAERQKQRQNTETFEKKE